MAMSACKDIDGILSMTSIAFVMLQAPAHLAKRVPQDRLSPNAEGRTFQTAKAIVSTLTALSRLVILTTSSWILVARLTSPWRIWQSVRQP